MLKKHIAIIGQKVSYFALKYLLAHLGQDGVHALEDEIDISFRDVQGRNERDTVVIIAVQLGHVIADVDGVGAFVKVDGNILCRCRGNGDLADDVVGGVLKVQLSAVVGEDNVTLEPDHPERT